MKKKFDLIFTSFAVIFMSILTINSANAGCNFSQQQGYCNMVATPVGNGEEEWDLECEELIDKSTNIGRCKLIITLR